jgi:molybdate transport system ATP-binding protein
VNAPVRLRVDFEKRFPALDMAVRLDAGAEVLVLFGPSGSGKSTVLNVLAGLIDPDAGEVAFGSDIFFRRGRPGPRVRLPARKRRVGYVFQEYALFPHLSAADNVAYALRGRPDARARSLALLDRVGLARVADARPAALSGGQQQRVAIARALAADRSLLLLDEPFAAFEAAVRERLQLELRALQREFGLCVIYVTHRVEDAFALGDRIAVLQSGRIAQCGNIDDVFRHPVTPEVAGVLGIRNLFEATVLAVDGETRLDWDGLELVTPPADLGTGTRVTAYIRPEDVKIVYPDRPLGAAVRENLVEVRILDRFRDAAFRILRVRLPNGRELEVRFPAYSYAPLPLEPGDTIRIALRREGIVLLTGPDMAATGKDPGRVLSTAQGVTHNR